MKRRSSQTEPTSGIPLLPAIVIGAGMLLMLVLGVLLTTLHGKSFAGERLEGTGPAKQVTFAEHIAPLIYAQCASCHRPGETAPFELLTYADVRRHAKDIADVTARRAMPPWKAEHGFGDFLGERRLTDEQIAMLREWVHQGCPQGDPQLAPPTPTFAQGWRLGEPDLVVRMGEPYAVPAEGRDIYRCFVIPLKVPAGKYIKAVEYRPGNRKIVHHAVITMLSHDKAMQKLAVGDGKSFSSGLNAPGKRLPGPMGIWTPGLEPQSLPEELASAWPNGTDLVLQLHLHPSGRPELEQSLIGLHFTDRQPLAQFQSMVLLDKVDIPAGDAKYVSEKSLVVQKPVDAYGIFPHMHLLGRTVKVTATLPDGQTIVPLLSINDWDFNWQNFYQYSTPVRLPAGTRI
ncbi:MAG TPA: cytochrome c, partial [Tepidisphaeraceae bacterium]|nr:cytochrome c [Tepidisphaeraceae bacterium]